MKMLETWVIYAFIAFAGYFFVNFLFKAVSKENPLIVSLVLYASAAIIMLFILVPKMNFSISTKSLILAIIIGICSVTATVFAIKSINLAPNPGYSAAIYSSSIIIITIASVFVYGSSITLLKFLGVLAVTIGIIILNI